MTTSSQSDTSAERPIMVECRGLRKRYGALTAVDGIDLRVHAGELFGFLGPNGAGKTTTIKMMTGLLRPTAGTVLVGGHDLQQDPLAAKSILGYIPDNPFLYEKLTGREFLHFMADLYSVPASGRSEKIDRLLALFELRDKTDELVQSYSRGMRQKLALAGALVHDPRVVFLDEPTVGLDPRSARLMKDTLRRLCNDGVAVFVTTHILEIAERMCDRFAIIARGRVVAEGTMSELRAQAASSKGSLEDIFLELTGGDEDREIVRNLE